MTNHKEQILEEFEKKLERIIIKQVESEEGMIYMVPKVSSIFSKALSKTQQATIEEVEKITKGVKHCGKKGCLLCEGADDTVAYILFESDKLKKG